MTEPRLEWHKNVIDDLINTNMSMRELATKYRRDASTIIKLAKRYGVSRKADLKSGFTPLHMDDPLSPIHKAIGVRISFYGDRAALREKLNVSRVRFLQMELGTYDYTLTDLLALCEALHLSMAELTKPGRVLAVTQ